MRARFLQTEAENGRLSALARAVGVTVQAASQGERVPANRVLAVEAHLGISRHMIRPDIYGPDPSSGPNTPSSDDTGDHAAGSCGGPNSEIHESPQLAGGVVDRAVVPVDASG